ncbi:MAG: nodulation protein NfeD [candidate division Zixibacteria bacterium]|nr:nodulation protein NfeD [candidate division Zixibacteria bacterium]
MLIRTRHWLIIALAMFMICQSAMADSTSDTAVSDSAKLREHQDVARALVYTMSIEGAIGATTAERIEDAVADAEDNNAELLVIFLDTPGGFSNATWGINKTILNSHVPVCVYIAPLGATAGSAGVYITYSAHFAAMAPTANIGAAHPVGGGGEKIDSVMNEKITNDAAAKMRSMAGKWHRNAVWGERAVRESVSITAKEALDSNVVDIIATDLDDLLAQLNGRETELPTGKKIMALSRVDIEKIDATFSQKALQIITTPEIVLLLFSVGGLGIVLELYNPGAIFPGVVGAISLILAFYGMQTLPINIAGLALIVLAIALWVAEIKVISHGLLFVGGLVSFFLGGLMLIDTVDPALKISISFLLAITLVMAALFGIVIWLVIKAHHRKVSTGGEGMLGKTAVVRTNDMVYVDGALWKAQCDEELLPGDKVQIVAIDKLLLKVKKLNSK